MPPTVPSAFPDWALAPPVQGSLNEQQTITITGVPVSGQFVLSVGQVNTATILWNDSNATIASKINAAYAAGTATIVSGTIAGGSLVVDFGALSQTNFIPVMVPSANTMLTSGGAAVIIQANVTQSSQLPATVPVDSGHTNNGWQFLEKPAFNLFNQWMGTVGLWVQYFWANTVTGIPAWNSAITYALNNFVSYNGQIYVSLTNSNLNNTPSALSTNWQLVNGNSVKGENLFINGSMLVAQAGTSGTVTASTPTYTLDGFIVNSVGANTAWSQTLVNNQNVLKLVPAGTLTDLYVKQRIESIQMQSIGYTNITIQAQITNNTGSTITPTLALNVATSTDSTYTTVALAATNLQPIANGATTIVAYTFAVTNAHAYQNGMEVVFDFGSSVGSGTNIEITNVDCSATPYVNAGLNGNPPTFKARQIETELLSCQRYFSYPIGGNVNGFAGVVGNMTTSTSAIFSINFPVTMRISPTMTWTSPANFTLVAWGPSSDGTEAVNAFNNLGISPSSYFFSASVLSALTASLPANLQSSGAGTASLSANARL